MDSAANPVSLPDADPVAGAEDDAFGLGPGCRPPADAPVPAAPGAPASLYRADSLRQDQSVAYLTKRAVQSILLQVDRRLAKHDLTHAQWLPLFKLLQGQCSTLVELARTVSMDPGAMTRALDRLEGKGLVRRVRSQQDRRVIQLELTPEGREVAQVVPAVIADVHNAHLAGFSHAEWETLIHLLQRLVANGDALRDTKDDTKEAE